MLYPFRTYNHGIWLKAYACIGSAICQVDYVVHVMAFRLDTNESMSNVHMHAKRVLRRQATDLQVSYVRLGPPLKRITVVSFRLVIPHRFFFGDVKTGPSALYMEKFTKGVKLGRVSFQKHHPLPHVLDTLEKPGGQTALDLYNEESSSMTCYYPLEVPKSPHQAMEFLSRTWSPSSSEFFQMLSSNGLVTSLKADKDQDQEVEEQGAEIEKVKSNVDGRLRVDHIWTVLSNGNPASRVHQRNKPSQGNWMNARDTKSWLSAKFLGSLSRRFRKKKKEELRLHVAQVHAALSVARLAAAITGIIAHCNLEPTDPQAMNMVCGESNKKMNSMIASAAALVATVCAEVAESVGANRALIASAMRWGLETHSSADIATLTATAATSLRGAATLELRATGRRCVSEDRKMLSRGAQLLIRTPGGKVQLRMVWIYLKHDKLTLRLGKVHLWGALTTYKECRIMEIMNSSREVGLNKHEHGLFSITLRTSEGIIQMLFQDEKQYSFWKSTISHLLSDH